jgi:hypothetical protein
MEYISEKIIKDHFHCGDCGAFSRFVGVYDIPCTDHMEYEEHKQREFLVFLVEKGVKDALNFAETDNPDIETLRAKINYAYDFYRTYGTALY